MANIKLIKLKEDIAIEIDLHPDKYKDAGKWLDDFCSKFKQNTLPQTCLSKALHYWLNKYDGYESVKAEDGRCILFISFLLLEPDCDKIAGILSIFALKPWITEDDIDSRAWAGIPLQIGEYG